MGGIQVFGNFVRNFLGTPGVIEDLAANRPAIALVGTLFVSTDTLLLQRFNGATWDTIGGGGGGTPTWQQTLDVAGGSLLTHDNTINAGNHDLFFTNTARAIVSTSAGDQVLLRSSGNSNINATTGFDFDVTSMLTFNIGNGEQHILAAGNFQVNTTNVNGAIGLDTAVGSHLLLDNTGYVEILSANANNINIQSVLDILLLANSGSATLGGGAGFTSVYNTAGQVQLTAGTSIISGATTDILSTAGGIIQMTASGGDIDLFASSRITLNATTSVSASSDFEAGGGVTIPTGEIIRYPTASAPGTTVVILPTTIFGGATSLLGAPTAWVDVMVGGIAKKMPAY